MNKMKRVYAILLCITILFSICIEVKASYSDDILNEEIKEQEKIENKNEEEGKDDEKKDEIKEEIMKLINSKSMINDPALAKTIYLTGNIYGFVNIKDIVVGSEYYILAYNQRLSPLLIRGEETIGLSLTNMYVNEQIGGFLDEERTTTNDFGYEIIREPIPELTPTPNPEESISGNYAPALNTIIENQERIISQNEVLLQSTIRIGDVLNDISNNQIVSVNGIMEKNINDYTTQEGLLLVIVVLAVSFVIVSAIKRGIFKWK